MKQQSIPTEIEKKGQSNLILSFRYLRNDIIYQNRTSQVKKLRTKDMKNIHNCKFRELSTTDYDWEVNM